MSRTAAATRSIPERQTLADRAGASERNAVRSRDSLLVALAVGGLLWSTIAVAQQPDHTVPAFSADRPSSVLSPRWIPFRVTPWKARTEYQLVAAEDGTTVL